MEIGVIRFHSCNSCSRRRFDGLLQQVLDELPTELKERLEEVPLVVDDEPSVQILDRLERLDGQYLCGLYTGIPLTERSVQHSGVLPDVIRIFRGGVSRAACEASGRCDDDALRRQIRITVLHEIGHHFGLDEEDLRAAGYQ